MFAISKTRLCYLFIKQHWAKSGCCLHTSLLRTRVDLQLDGLINSTAVPSAVLDQGALTIIASHTFDLPASFNTGNCPVIINAHCTSDFGLADTELSVQMNMHSVHMEYAFSQMNMHSVRMHMHPGHTNMGFR